MTLALRPLTVRLNIAYMAMAASKVAGNPYPDCFIGNSLERLATKNHPYTRIWKRVNDFYNAQDMDKLCDAELTDQYRAAMAVGFTTKGGRKVAASDIHEAVAAWQKRGWFRYEQRRNGRRQVAYKYAPLAALSLVGLFGGVWISPKA